MKIKCDVNLQNNELTEVDLQLKKLEEYAVTRYDTNSGNRKKIDLRGNPWDCSCKNLDFFRYVQGQMISEVYNYVDIIYDSRDKCLLPINFNSTFIDHIPLEDLECF